MRSNKSISNEQEGFRKFPVYPTLNLLFFYGHCVFYRNMRESSDLFFCDDQKVSKKFENRTKTILWQINFISSKLTSICARAPASHPHVYASVVGCQKDDLYVSRDILLFRLVFEALLGRIYGPVGTSCLAKRLISKIFSIMC